jgi:hypothetical protein
VKGCNCSARKTRLRSEPFWLSRASLPTPKVSIDSRITCVHASWIRQVKDGGFAFELSRHWSRGAGYRPFPGRAAKPRPTALIAASELT